MHISWSFLDKRKGAIKAIAAYDSMDFIVKHTDEEIAAVRVRMEGIGSPNLDAIRKQERKEFFRGSKRLTP